MTDTNFDLLMENLEQAIFAIIRNQKIITQELIQKTAMMFAPSFPALTCEHLDKVIKRIETRCSITMGYGGSLAEDYTPWFNEAKADIEWYYWPKYRDLLGDKGFGTQVISSSDNVTDRILALAENPKKDGNWERKGMVVGHVQSGKTSNYLGLISKAADAGYKVFIVIAGITNDLRKQTQMRIEEGFTGYDTSDTNHEPVGVGKVDLLLGKRPITFTTINKDFNRATASQVGANIQSFNAPVIFVIKKGSRVLQNLIDWLQQSKQSNDEVARIDDVPMMLIDDEADNASVNTKKNPEEATKINYLIRQLLNQFNKRCYIGYTATPFANIFIDDTHIEGIGGDLFPRDFIYCLEAPSNYCGANKIFGADEEDSIVRTIDDHQDETGETGLLPFAHNKELSVESLPQSLIDATNLFFLVRTIRILRGDGNKHNSMLVNVSRFNAVQKKVRDKLIEYLTEAQNNIRYAYKMKNALEHPIIARLKELFDLEYADCEFSWKQILEKLNDAVAPIKIYTINQSSGDGLDYENYQNGQNIIAVGGLALSRGLTLEGLSISYIIRNTMMYDTLMQMGRWFGYRGGYEDLCRIYMPKESEDWYKSVNEATNELIADFQCMARLNATPKNFGLRVKQSPFNLLITAKNKMWHGTAIREKADLSGHYKETMRVFISPDALAHNQKIFYNTIEKLQTKNRLTAPNDKGYLWSDVPADVVLDFVRDYKNHDSSIETQMSPLHRFINHIKEKDGKDLWDVVLVSLDKLQAGNSPFDLPIKDSIRVIPPMRTAGRTTPDGKGVEVSSRRKMASQGIEKVGLTDTQIAEAEASERYARGDKDGAYRENRTKPLLVLFLANVEKKDKANSTMEAYNQVPVYAVSFPYITRDYEYKGEEYVANAQWIKENYGLFENDDEDEYEREE